MPDIGYYHPQIVHFVIGLLIAGVAFRWLSLTGKVPWTGPAAMALLLAGALAAVVAVQSGLDAHELAERVPGIRAAVNDHEDAGKWARDVFLVVALLEIGILVFRRQAWHRWIVGASALVGLVGVGTLYQAGSKGGTLVYDYAGGIGLRSGDSTDVRRLLVAGLFNQATVDRQAKRDSAAAARFDQLKALEPADPEVQLIWADSQLRDRHDGRAALRALAALPPAGDDPRQAIRRGMLAADAYVALNKPDSARAVLTPLVQQFPQFTRLKDRLAQIH